VDTPERPREGNAARLGRAAYFIVFFLPWVTGSIAGWSIRPSDEVGLLALAVLLVELLRVMGIWTIRGADLVGFCLTAAVGVMGVTTWAVLQWASGPVENGTFAYGYWLGFVVALVLIALAALRLAVLSRSAP
jgi:hypothetical protein